MAYCTNCGTVVPDDAAFCQKCGQPQKPTASAAAPTRSAISENTAALLSYVLGWLTGLVFLLIDQRPYVRFHAAQALITFGGLHIIRLVLGAIFGFGWWMGGFGGMRHLGVGFPILGLLSLLTFVLWIVLMVKAYQGQWFKLPLTGDIAEQLVGHPPRSRVR